MKMEYFSEKVLDELKSGEIAFFKRAKDCDYIMIYKDGREHGVKKEWVENVLPYLRKAKVKYGDVRIDGLVFNNSK